MIGCLASSGRNPWLTSLVVLVSHAVSTVGAESRYHWLDSSEHPSTTAEIEMTGNSLDQG